MFKFLGTFAAIGLLMTLTSCENVKPVLTPPPVSEESQDIKVGDDTFEFVVSDVPADATITYDGSLGKGKVTIILPDDDE